MHLLVGAFFVFVIWSHPVLRSLVLIAFAALLCFAFLPVIVAGIVTAVVVVWMSAAARDELRARRQWLDDEALLRSAALWRARREIHG